MRKIDVSSIFIIFCTERIESVEDILKLENSDGDYTFLMKIKEKEIQKAILQYLKLKKVFCWKHNNVGIKKPNGQWIPTGMLGVSDIIGITEDGRFLAIEVKATGSKPSDHQLNFIDNINQRGGMAFIAYSLDDVIAMEL